MSLAEAPFVGNASARRVHGFAAGSTALLVGDPADGSHLAEAVAELGLVPQSVSGGSAGDVLARLAREAAALATSGAAVPLTVFAADLRVSAVALLDLVDRPSARTSVAIAGPHEIAKDPSAFTLIRVERTQRLVHSVGSARHVVSAPNALAVGALLVAPEDVPAAAQLWAAAADDPWVDPALDPFDLALVALVRGGVSVSSVPLGPYDVRRGAGVTVGAAGSPWQQRLYGASRGDDGFFSTFAVRPLSRRLTAFGLAHGWSPNVVTVTSLGLGVLAALLTATESRAAWVAAAVLLLSALVVDCVDGEIARFSRRFSALGAWLDAVGDRVKEYALLAAVAWVSVRRGEPAWLLATTAMALTTMRHLEDGAYMDRTATSRSHLVPDRLDLGPARDLGPADAPTSLPGAVSRRASAVSWAKRVAHMPIAERYLVLALGLLTGSTQVVLWAITLTVAGALVWSQGGRTVKALLGSDGYERDARRVDGRWSDLDHETDLGPLARGAGRIAPLPFTASVVGVGMVAVCAWFIDTGRLPRVAVVLAVLAALVVGAGCRPSIEHRLGWQVPAALWGAESLLVLGVAATLPGGGQWCAYAYLAAVAWHRYDVLYRLRDTGSPSASWVTAVTLGVDGRWVLLAFLVATGASMQSALAWAAVLLTLVYGAESAAHWRAWLGREGALRSEVARREAEV
ncbi:DUF5941 domain-containing protein [Pedococcus sp. KACC 23699]|uniref:DUF5941 domain-containing protein n=1 Tax=Pedococcus sp. KACC 23699 TaxID=3149228 RepID=A0AAU7JVC8_9MICO